MKQIISTIRLLVVMVLSSSMFMACNKEEELIKAVSIEVWGYNVGDTELEVSVDTVVYRNFRIQPNKPVSFGKVYKYPSNSLQALLKIKDITSGKAVFQQHLSLGGEDLELFFPLVLINQQPLTINSPVADPSTNKLGFYIHYPQSSDALDIYLKNESGQMVYIAKSVKPSTWTYVDYILENGFKEAGKNYTLHFTKTGTTDSWAFQDNEWMSQVYENSLYFPKG